MSKFRKKPAVIEAVRVTAADFNGETWDGSPFSEAPDWLRYALDSGDIVVEPSNTDYAIWRVYSTPERMPPRPNRVAGPDDWIIRGADGDLSVCTREEFMADYEPVEEQEK